MLRIKSFIHFTIASVWFINGLYCKVLDMVPRHQEIVGAILGQQYARPLTLLIGLSEIALGILILLKRYPRSLAAMQIAIVLLMNILETLLVPELLLWGHWNLLFAILFCGLIYYEGFILRETPSTKSHELS